MTLIHVVFYMVLKPQNKTRLEIIVSANLLPNLVVEFYFLVQLLTARGGGEGENLVLEGEGQLSY